MDEKSRELVMAKLYLKNKDYKMAEKSFNEYMSKNPGETSASPSEEDSLKRILDRLEKLDQRLSGIEEKLDSLKLDPPKSEDAPTKAPSEDAPTKAPREDAPTKAPREDAPTKAPREDAPTKGPSEDAPIKAPSEDAPPKAPALSLKEASPFSFSSSLSLSGNPFADSLKKFNLPTEGEWTKKSQDPDPDPEPEPENDKVPTEELPIENTCDMKPIEIKTGEEDEEIIIEQRCKLYRFRDKEYKERGVGNIKLLQHRDTKKGRLIMRRDQIGLVCLNCWDCQKVERVRDTQIRWVALDASDGEAQSTVFLVKFKTPDMTDKFMSHMQELF